MKLIVSSNYHSIIWQNYQFVLMREGCNFIDSITNYLIRVQDCATIGSESYKLSSNIIINKIIIRST